MCFPDFLARFSSQPFFVGRLTVFVAAFVFQSPPLFHVFCPQLWSTRFTQVSFSWTGRCNFAIQEQGRDLQLKLCGYEGKNLVGPVTPGKGNGAGYYYADLFDQAMSTKQVLTVRLKQLDDESELKMWVRQIGVSRWGAEWKAIRSSTVASFDGAMKQAKTMVQQVRFMYAFALLAASKKWLPKDVDFDVVAQDMLVSAFKDEKGSFCEWYDRLAPSKQEYIVMTKKMSKDEVKALIVQELARAFHPKINSVLFPGAANVQGRFARVFSGTGGEMAGLLLRRMMQPDISQKPVAWMMNEKQNDLHLMQSGGARALLHWKLWHQKMPRRLPSTTSHADTATILP